MKIFAFVILIVAIFAFAWGQETCNVGGKTLKKGETHQPAGQCQIMECTGKNQLIGKTCPLLVGAFTCSIVQGDLSKPYPACCDSLNCKPGK